MKISTVAQMREMDRTAIETYGIDELILMENAGAASVRVLAEQIAVGDKRGLIICGGGNNGGDGFVVARHIHGAGGKQSVLVMGDAEKYGGAARANLEVVKKLGIPMQTGFEAEQAARLLEEADYVVDGLFGTGLGRPVEGDYASLIELINDAKKPVLSLDIPSGVNGDTGAVMGCAVQASWTVTYGLPKPGNLLFPGHGLNGEVAVTHISFPPDLYRGEGLKLEINDPIALPPRDPDGHKSSFGQVLVVAGAKSYYGAPYFSAMSFMAAGGGYSRLATPASMAPYLSMNGREIVLLPQSETAEGAIEARNAESLAEVGNKMDFVIVGPGLSLEDDAQKLARALVEAIEQPLLLDGDGLTAVAEHRELVAARKGPTVLTPHLGEMARLTGQSVDEIRKDRIAALQAACAAWQAVIVLKGAHSLIGMPDGRVYVNLSGNSGMGSAGSGDVLTGIIGALAGLLADVKDSHDRIHERVGLATRMGVFVHGLAGDIAAEYKGMDGMTAQDILAALPEAMLAVRQGDVGQRYRVRVVT